jgi:lipopolysaccharide export system protein LptC
MGDRLTNTVPLVLIAILAGLTYWLDQIAHPEMRAASPSGRNDPDYIVDGLSAISMNKTGAASYALSAARMLHYPEDDSTLMTHPRFVSYVSAKAPLTITANQAVVSANGENVYFQDDVHVTRAAYGNNSELVVQTAFLHVMPDANVAKTDRPVTITEAATTVTAVGFELNNETRVIKLLSDVRGTYDSGKALRR